jgi:hypothetical protein
VKCGMQFIAGGRVAVAVDCFSGMLRDKSDIERMSERASGIYTYHGDGVLCVLFENTVFEGLERKC